MLVVTGVVPVVEVKALVINDEPVDPVRSVEVESVTGLADDPIVDALLVVEAPLVVEADPIVVVDPKHREYRI